MKKLNLLLSSIKFTQNLTWLEIHWFTDCSHRLCHFISVISVADDLISVLENMSVTYQINFLISKDPKVIS